LKASFPLKNKKEGKRKRKRKEKKTEDKKFKAVKFLDLSPKA
jgi:hypothetical protein